MKRYIGWDPEKRSFCSPEIWDVGTMAHGSVLLNKPGNSLNPLLFALLQRLHYVIGNIDYITGK